jgi:GLPGLI family protein
MVKKIIYLIFLCFSCFSFGQKNVLIAKYNYTDISGSRIETLTADEKIAFYQVISKPDLNKEKSNPKIRIEGDNIFVEDFSNHIFSNFIFLSNSKDENFTYLKNLDNKLIVHDSMPELNWKLLNEEKLIDKYNCKKAEVQFRGRKFTAWYAPKIAVPFGPFKFKGLPGLIINMESTYNGSTLYWNLTSLRYDNSIVVPSKSSFDGKEITLREVLTNETNERNDRSKRTVAKMGRGIRQTKVTLERLGAERIYEWETEDEEKK